MRVQYFAFQYKFIMLFNNSLYTCASLETHYTGNKCKMAVVHYLYYVFFRKLLIFGPM